MVQRILLIENNPTSQDIIASLLANRGYRVDLAQDSFSALELARSAFYDVFMMDSGLPEVAWLLADRKTHTGAAPVLLGLTYDRAGPVQTLPADSPFDALIVKPIRPAALFAAIDKNLKARAQKAAHLREKDPRHPTQHATLAHWRSHGLTAHPKAFVCPAPSPTQTEALSLCFQLVEAASAEIIILLDREHLAEAKRASRLAGKGALPIIGLADDYGDVCEAIFAVGRAASWAKVAALLGGGLAVRDHAPTKRRIESVIDTTSIRRTGGKDVASKLAALLTQIDRQLQLAPGDPGDRRLLRETSDLIAETIIFTNQLIGMIEKSSPP